jgi:pSer/pThr/pTyr-binding forkhead associated (FHA) protein
MTEPTYRPTSAPPRSGVTGVLLVAHGDGRPVAVPVHRLLTLGRELDCDVVLDSPTVSRHHARVWPEGSRFGIQDLGSRNGTRVNGHLVTSAAELRDGDRLTLADVDLQFRLLAPDAVPPVPRQHVAAAPDAASPGTQPLPPERRGGSGVGPTTILLAVLLAVAGTAISQAIGTGLAGTYAFAVIVPLLGTALVLRRHGRVRAMPVVLVTALAVLVTVLGLTAAETSLGRSVFPWSDAPQTFLAPPALVTIHLGA